MIRVNIVIDRILQHPSRIFFALPRIGECVYLSDTDPVYKVVSVTHFANRSTGDGNPVNYPDLHLTAKLND